MITLKEDNEFYIKSCEEGVELGAMEYLVDELGENFKDIIEMEWGMTVSEFCAGFMECDNGKYWSCLV